MSNKITSHKKFTGEQYYSGIILGVGPVAKEVPYVKDNNLLDKYINGEKGAKLITKLSSSLINKINEEKPNYFNDFKRIMESGNPLKIKNSIQSAFKLKDKVAPTILDIPIHEKAYDIISNHPNKVKGALHHLFKETSFAKEHNIGSEDKMLSKLAQETGLKTYKSQQLGDDEFYKLSEENSVESIFNFDFDVDFEFEFQVAAAEEVVLITLIGEKENKITSSSVAMNKISKSIATNFR